MVALPDAVAETHPHAENAEWCQNPLSAPFGTIGTGAGSGTGSWRERLRTRVKRMARPTAPALWPAPGLPPAGDVEPSGPCPACGSGTFHHPPGGRWCCSTCEPPGLPVDPAGWMFCSVAGDRCLPPLPMPPSAPVYLDELLPNPRTAPIGMCRQCRFIAPLEARSRLCGRCRSGGGP
jgi:hypothetical protein